MNDLVTNIGIDIVTLISLVAYIVRMEMKQKELIQRRKEDLASLEKVIEKNEVIMFKKFTNVHTRMDKTEEQYKGEFEKINKELSEVKSGIASINGKLDILISK